MSSDDTTHLRVKISGPDVTAEDAQEIGNATKDLVEMVIELQTGAHVDIPMTIRRMCDGCEAYAPDDGLPSNWKHLPDGTDLCEVCAGERSKSMSGFSTQLIVDADRTEHGWEIVLRFDAEGMEAAWTGVSDEGLSDVAHELGVAVIDAILRERNA